MSEELLRTQARTLHVVVGLVLFRHYFEIAHRKETALEIFVWRLLAKKLFIEVLLGLRLEIENSC